jgi:hypothetical protein
METYAGKWREVRRLTTGAHGGVDGDSPRRGDGGLQTDTIGTPSDGGSSWSLREPCGEEDGEVSAAAWGKAAVWQPHQHRRDTFGQWRPERVIGVQLSDRDVVGRRLYISACMMDNTALLGQSADGVWQLSR